MPDDGVIQLRRNHSKQAIAPSHLRLAKGNKGSTARLSKYGITNARKAADLQKTYSGSSLNQGGPAETEPGETGYHASTRAPGPHHRSKGGKPNISVGAASGTAFGSHRYRGLSGLGNLAQPHRKPVIQLERDDEDEDDSYDAKDGSGSEDFEDYEEDESEEGGKHKASTSPDKNNTQLNIGIQPVEPSPPKLSEETVISVSSLADMASALEGARNKSAFVGQDDLISTAVNRSKNLGNMARMVRGWNSSAQLGTTHSKSRKSIVASSSGNNGNTSSIPGEEDPREFEKVFREYTNSRAISNPVISSLYRISASKDSASSPLRGTSLSSTPSIKGDGSSSNHNNTNNGLAGIQLPAIKKVNSLVATTANQMSDYSERRHDALLPEQYSSVQSHGAIESVSTYTLNKIWQMGWVDPEYSKTPSTLTSRAPGIQGQAIKVQKQLAGARDRQLGSSPSSQ